MANDWLELRQHAETGIETIKAHFEGHAFDRTVWNCAVHCWPVG